MVGCLNPVESNQPGYQSDRYGTVDKSPPLTPLAVIHHLQNRGIADGSLVTDGHILVTESSRRHVNYKVTTDDGLGYFVKHAPTIDRITTLAREAKIHAMLSAANGCIGSLNRYLPKLLDYDSRNHILVFELIPGAVNLREYQLRHRWFSKGAARAIGRAVGMLHDEMRLGSIGRGSLEAFRDEPPGALSLHQPYVSFLAETSSASLDLICLIQSSSELCELLDQLRMHWMYNALIHRDLKWDNAVTHISAHTKRAGHPIIVDWELAGVGDADWDIGSIFSDYLNTWLLSIPMGSGGPFDRYLEYARYPLRTMHPAITAFWDSYVRARNFDRDAAYSHFVQAVKYAAARLIQSAFEQSQVSYELGSGAGAAVQLSLNILRRPHEAGIHLLGIS